MSPIGSHAISERLLDLFPADTLRVFEEAEGSPTKAERIDAILDRATEADLRRFVSDHFGRLHQHVYVLAREGDGDIALEQPFGGAFEVRDVDEERHAFYLETLTHQLVIDSPLEHRQLRFAWPLKVVEAPDHVRVHFTIMNKSPQAYMEDGRRVVSSSPAPRESQLLEQFRAVSGIDAAQDLDLNRGVKALWDAGEYDAPSVKYKRTRATSKDVMDEAFMVRSHDPDLYEELQDKPLFGTTLRFMDDDPCIDYFFVNPTNGFLRFRRYSATNECVDRVIRRIVAAN